MTRYIPKRAEVVLLNFDIAKGTEPGNDRPCVVLTDYDYNKSGRAIVMGISTSIRGTPLEVSLDVLYQQGVLDKHCVLCVDLVRHMDWRARNIKRLGRLGMDQYTEAIEKLGALMGDELLD